MSDHKQEPELLARVSPARREFVRDLIKGGFAVPAIASFSMATLQVATLGAQVGHGS